MRKYNQYRVPDRGKGEKENLKKKWPKLPKFYGWHKSSNPNNTPNSLQERLICTKFVTNSTAEIENEINS